MLRCMSQLLAQTRSALLMGANRKWANGQNGCLRHCVLLVFGAPCQLRLLAGQEHGRTIPLADTRPIDVWCPPEGAMLWPARFFVPRKLAGVFPSLCAFCRNFPATMMEHRMRTTRRTFVRASLATAAAALLPISLHTQEGSPARRLIPSTREAIPIVGLGTWITFNVGGDPVLRDECASVMAAFFEAGGRMIDSSP